MEVEEMQKIRLDGIDVEVSKPAQQIIEKVLGQKDQEIAALGKHKEELQARFDEAVGQISKLTESLKEAQDMTKIRAAYQARMDLEQKANKLLPEEKFDAVEDKEIKRLVVAKKHPELAEKSDDYISARFDAMVEAAEQEEQNKPKAGNLGQVLGAIESNAKARLDSDPRSGYLNAQAKAAEDLKNRWKSLGQAS